MEIERFKKDQTVLFKVAASDDFTRKHFPRGNYQHAILDFEAGAEMPGWIGELDQLRELTLFFDGDHAIPAEMFDMPNLRRLYIRGDRLRN